MLAEQLAEIGFYVVFAGIGFTLLLVLVALVLSPMIVKGGRTYISWLSRAALFLALLFGWGCVANSVWFGLPIHRWYVAGDPLIRFSPIVPLGRWTLDEACGGHLQPGVSMLSLQALWALFTVIVWSLAWISYTRLRDRRRPAEPLFVSRAQ